MTTLAALSAPPLQPCVADFSSGKARRNVAISTGGKRVSGGFRAVSQFSRPSHRLYAATPTPDASAAAANFGPMPTRNVSADLSRDAFGLIGLTTRKFILKRFTSWL